MARFFGFIIFALFVGACSYKENFEEITPSLPPWQDSLSLLQASGKADKSLGNYAQIEAMQNAKDNLQKKLTSLLFKAISQTLLELSPEESLKDLQEKAMQISVFILPEIVEKSKLKQIWFDEQQSMYVLVFVQKEDILPPLSTSFSNFLSPKTQEAYEKNGYKILKNNFNQELNKPL